MFALPPMHPGGANVRDSVVTTSHSGEGTPGQTRYEPACGAPFLPRRLAVIAQLFYGRNAI